MKLTELRPWEERASGAWAYYNDLHEKKLGLYFLGRIGTDIPFLLYLIKPIATADLKGLKHPRLPHVPSDDQRSGR